MPVMVLDPPRAVGLPVTEVEVKQLRQRSVCQGNRKLQDTGVIFL